MRNFKKKSFMIKTKTIICSIEDVPTQWVFNRYLTKCPVLTGQDVLIHSVFNSKDRTPSMSIFVWKGKGYRFNDHSTGIKGGPVDLVIELCKLKGEKINYGQACLKIVEDYNNYLLTGNSITVTEFKERAKYKPIDHPIRAWDKTDDNYWGQYELREEDLKYYEAYPLESYTLSNGENTLKIQGFHIYGYFTKAGELYKIYQPIVRDRRFLKVKDHVQGLEQLNRPGEILVISKSLKDLAGLRKMNFEGCQYISPDSENSMLREPLLRSLQGSFKRVFTLMDNDSAGVLASGKYKELYGILPLPLENLGLEKDPTDSIKKLGFARVKEILSNVFREMI